MSKKLKRSRDKGTRYKLIPISSRKRMTPDAARVYMVIAAEVGMAKALFDAAELGRVLKRYRKEGKFDPATYSDKEVVKMAHQISDALVEIERGRRGGMN